MSARANAAQLPTWFILMSILPMDLYRLHDAGRSPNGSAPVTNEGNDGAVKFNTRHASPAYAFKRQ
jgi:hypothetical protein